ncbi:MAG: hypothetical protein PHW15_01070 [Patescibacteria group bacterium]|jgi:hypothetical protein|nr:hypothetical protein [Patescibacteria group bacterium]MDD5172697.1 hypothetical protein [Patescibacteria group bacterium]
MFEQFISQFFLIKIGAIQAYLLWFLLGSFTVATLSDLKHMSAQREFLEIWVLFIVAMLATDFYYQVYLTDNLIYLLIKWGLIIIFLPVYFHYIRHVAWGDVFAKMSACSLLSPLLIIIFIVLIRIIDFITRPLWKKRGNNRFYPFMPVIFFTTLILIIASIFIFN